MIESGNDELHKMDDIQKRLYSKSPNAIPKQRQGILHPVEHTVSTQWKEPTMKDKVVTGVKDATMRTSFFKKFFIGAVVFFLIAAGIGFFLFLSGSNSVSDDNIGITILGNAYTPGGESLPLTVQISNTNAVPLELVDLVVQYGRNKPTVTDPSDLTTNRISIGEVPAGKIVNQKVDLTLYGDQGSNKDVKFTLEYHVQGSNAIFQKDKLFSVVINTVPVTLAVDAPTSITADQPYTFTVSLTSNVKKTIPNMVLKIDYPTGFAFQSAEPSSTYMTNVWNFGDVNPGDTKQIKVTGTISAQDGEERSFRIYAGSASDNDKNTIGTTFASTLQSVDIVKPFLEAKLAINGQTTPTVIAQSKSTINGTINWANNLPVRILDATVTLTLHGALVDQSTVQDEGGFYNSADNTITWNRNTLPDLASVAPGANGTLGFTFATQSLYQSGSLVSDPQVTLDISITGKQPQEGTYSQEVNSIEHTTIKLATDFQVSGQAFYSGQPFINNGPLPPAANQKTDYTIKWVLTSSANDVTGAQVRAALPAYVHYLNNVSPANSSIKVDPISGDIVWTPGTVAKGSGFTGSPVSVYFQVELDPSISQVGTVPNLVNTMTATGTDTYTNTALSSSWKGIDTRIYNDPFYQNGFEKVAQ